MKLKYLLILVLFAVSIYIIYLPKAANIPQKAIRIATLTPSPIPPPTAIAALPSKFLIKTAFVPQSPQGNWSEPWQDACEEATILTAKYYYTSTIPTTPQIIDDLQSEFNYETSQGWTHDINVSQMSLLAQNLFHLKTKILNNPTLQELKTAISQSTPVVIPANGKTLFKENSHFNSGGPWYHNLIILGYDDTTDQFIVHDVGTKAGQYYRYSYQIILDSIHDFPNSGKKEDINQGAKRALVLLK